MKCVLIHYIRGGDAINPYSIRGVSDVARAIFQICKMPEFQVASGERESDRGWSINYYSQTSPRAKTAKIQSDFHERNMYSYLHATTSTLMFVARRHLHWRKSCFCPPLISCRWADVRRGEHAKRTRFTLQNQTIMSNMTHRSTVNIHPRRTCPGAELSPRLLKAPRRPRQARTRGRATRRGDIRFPSRLLENTLNTISNEYKDFQVTSLTVSKHRQKKTTIVGQL